MTLRKRTSISARVCIAQSQQLILPAVHQQRLTAVFTLLQQIDRRVNPKTKKAKHKELSTGWLLIQSLSFFKA